MDSGLLTFTAEFVTANRSIRATLSSPERRLSDYLNGSYASIECQLDEVRESGGNPAEEARSDRTVLNKDRVLFVVPLMESSQGGERGTAYWKPTEEWLSWTAIGGYWVAGTLHTDVYRDASIALRRLDKQFVPVTGACVTFPDGTEHDYGIVLINRPLIDVISIRSKGSQGGERPDVPRS